MKLAMDAAVGTLPEPVSSAHVQSIAESILRTAKDGERDPALLLLSLISARASTIYPTPPCRVFVDTDYTQIAEQCGTVKRFYPRRLFVVTHRWHITGVETLHILWGHITQ